MVSKQLPCRCGWFKTAEHSHMLEIGDACSVRPVDMAVGTVVPVPTFVIHVDADTTVLDDLDHAHTVSPSQDIVRYAKCVGGATASRAYGSSRLSRRMSMCSRARPVPTATQESGSSAT